MPLTHIPSAFRRSKQINHHMSRTFGSVSALGGAHIDHKSLFSISVLLFRERLNVLHCRGPTQGWCSCALCRSDHRHWQMQLHFCCWNQEPLEEPQILLEMYVTAFVLPFSSVHMEEASVMQGAQGMLVQNWPTVSSAAGEQESSRVHRVVFSNTEMKPVTLPI